VTNSLRLLKLPEKVQLLLETNALSAGHARALLGIEDPASIELLADTVIGKGLNVRATEVLVKNSKAREPLLLQNLTGKNPWPRTSQT
jgi:chromosome segregation DNA-binding protein